MDYLKCNIQRCSFVLRWMDADGWMDGLIRKRGQLNEKKEEEKEERLKGVPYRS